MVHLGSLTITKKTKELLAAVEHVHGNHIDVPKQYKVFAFIKKKRTHFPTKKKHVGTTDYDY